MSCFVLLYGVALKKSLCYVRGSCYTVFYNYVFVFLGRVLRWVTCLATIYYFIRLDHASC